MECEQDGLIEDIIALDYIVIYSYSIVIFYDSVGLPT